uniref:Uncharacterized protein n=1 Tax=Onchocerca volvulus TaxID=6282 RepID=A0A8R1XR72_ONCVO
MMDCRNSTCAICRWIGREYSKSVARRGGTSTYIHAERDEKQSRDKVICDTESDDCLPYRCSISFIIALSSDKGKTSSLECADSRNSPTN